MIDNINTIFERVYGYPLFKDTHGPKMRNHMNSLIGLLSSVPLREGDTREDLARYHSLITIAYTNRTFWFNPPVSMMCSEKFFEVTKDRYLSGIPVLASEEFMATKLAPMRTRKQGLFFGYSFDEVKQFSSQSTEAILAKVITGRSKASLQPSKRLALLLDKVFFLSLGNNYLEEKKQAQGNIHSTPMVTPYSTLEKLKDYRDHLLDNTSPQKEGTVYEELGYKLVAKVGTLDISYCELLLWHKGLERKDRSMISFIQNRIPQFCALKLAQKLLTQEFADYVEALLKKMRESVPEAEWPLVKQALLQSDLPIVQRRLKEFREARKEE